LESAIVEQRSCEGSMYAVAAREAL
jgi:hypothetical protein